MPISRRHIFDRLTQSHLSKAFRGELVPRHPNDEPTAVVIERISAQRAAVSKPQRGRRRRVTVEELSIVAEPKKRYRKRKA